MQLRHSPTPSLSPGQMPTYSLPQSRLTSLLRYTIFLFMLLTSSPIPLYLQRKRKVNHCEHLEGPPLKNTGCLLYACFLLLIPVETYLQLMVISTPLSMLLDPQQKLSNISPGEGLDGWPLESISCRLDFFMHSWALKRVIYTTFLVRCSHWPRQGTSPHYATHPFLYSFSKQNAIFCTASCSMHTLTLKMEAASPTTTHCKKPVSELTIVNA